jgi:uncharacterized protein (DUF1501 family)
VLVTVFLDGGIDSLSVLFPYGDADYRRLRPRLALPDSGLVFPEDTRLRWHPSAASFHTLHAEGKLAVLPAVGYTNADQSHFTSRHYWEVGDTDPRLQTAGSAGTSTTSARRTIRSRASASTASSRRRSRPRRSRSPH